MMETEKCTSMIVHDLERNLPSTEFDKWPLHITIVFYFNYENTIQNKVVDLVAEIAGKIGPIEAIPGKIEMYGANKDVIVTEISDNENKLILLHNLLISGLSDIGCQFQDSAYVLDNYLPHVSNQGELTCPAEKFIINDISIVSKINGDNENNKMIFKNISLNGAVY